MNSAATFEVRLIRALADYTDQGALPFDADDIVERAIGSQRPMRFSALLVPLVVVALLLALAIGIVVLSTPDEPPPTPSAETSVSGGSLRTPRSPGLSATLLPGGRVLVFGGVWSGMGGQSSTSAELWDPSSGSSTLTGTLVEGRNYATATLLADGRVLAVGGYGGYAYASTALASAEVWDPASESFSETGSLHQPRVQHTATLLGDGRVLVMGGNGPGGQMASVEIWDPTSGTFSEAGSMSARRGGHTATLLPDGRVLIVGGTDTDLVGSGAAEVWDPGSGAFSPAGSLAEARSGHTANLLPDGRVLIVGGWHAADTSSGPNATNTMEVWDPADQTFSQADSLAESRLAHTATVLSDGRVVVAGGADDPIKSSVEVWDPTTGSTSPGRSLTEARHGHIAILLSNDRVLIMGGHGDGAELDPATDVEIWDARSGGQ